jgi:hypothetical protein
MFDHPVRTLGFGFYISGDDSFKVVPQSEPVAATDFLPSRLVSSPYSS